MDASRFMFHLQDYRQTGTMRVYMEVRMTLKNRIASLASLRRGAIPFITAIAGLVLIAACSARSTDGSRVRSGTDALVATANDLGLEIGDRPRETSAAAMSGGKHEAEKELSILAGGSASTHTSSKLPGPDDWRVITNSLNLFRHAPYVTDLVLGLVCSIGVALTLTASPRRAVRFDPVAVAETRKATVICALVGCIAAELVQSSEQFLLGAEIALVLFGIGGLVRFRTIFGDARQTGVAIIATVLGLACGMSEYSLVALSLTVVFIANWWMNSTAFVHVRVRVRKNGDLAQVQAAITTLLQEQHFSVLRATPNSTERTIEMFGQTASEFDIDALVSSIEGAVPGARVRVKAS
jgi:hypothetical protein